MSKKYIVIWWNTAEDRVNVSKPLLFIDAIKMVSAMEKGKLFFREKESGGLDSGESYKSWSFTITEYKPIFEKDLYGELKNT